MAKKRVILDYTPSVYQEKIFDFVEHGVGNAVISATAGSGKTSTIVSAMKYIPSSHKCLFIAFNKSIVAELDSRLTNKHTNVKVRTAHSLGYTIVRNAFDNVPKDDYKYRTYVKNNILSLSNVSDCQLNKREVAAYIERICFLIDYARFNMAQSVKEITQVAEKYSIACDYDECNVVYKCLEWGKEHVETVDFTDMIWLPVELDLSFRGNRYDWVIIDEAQDLSLLDIQLFLKCFKRGTRFIAVGDKNQSINQFAGASEEAFEYLCNYPNTTVFSLPVSYRCDKVITELAQTFVPEMLYRDDAGKGEIIDNYSYKKLKGGDMVLSRTKAPLFQLYMKMLTRGMNCFIKGQDIGKNLDSLLHSIDKKELNVRLEDDGVFVRLYDHLFSERNKLMQIRGLDFEDATLSEPILNLYDSIATLEALSDRLHTKNELIHRLERVFVEDEDAICLSTIHKSKGLEADNVYILCHSALPAHGGNQPWEQEQERNLVYVAYTRARKRLGFISEKEIPPSARLLAGENVLTDLINIEKRVCNILNKKPTEHVQTEEMARFQARAFRSMNNITSNDNIVEIASQTKKSNLLMELNEIGD